MKKILGLVLVLNLAVAASAAEVPMLSFKQSDCHKLEGMPNIVVCVEGNPGTEELDLNTLRALKGATKSLITKYNARAAAKNRVSINKPATSPLPPTLPPPARDPCVLNPMGPGCMPVDPCLGPTPRPTYCSSRNPNTTDPCVLNPMGPGCTSVDPCLGPSPRPTYCSLRNPSTTDPCVLNPMGPGCM